MNSYLMMRWALMGIVCVCGGCRDSDSDLSGAQEPQAFFEAEFPDGVEGIIAKATHGKDIERKELYGDRFFVKRGSVELFSGWCKMFYESGKIKFLAEVRSGKLHGVSLRWREDGTKYFMATYEAGLPNGQTLGWYANGNKKQQIFAKYGKQHGVVTSWYESGQKESELTFKKGVFEGLFIQWHENGKLASRVNFKEGEFDGPFVKWHENGQKALESFYVKGQLQEGGILFDEDGVAIPRARGPIKPPKLPKVFKGLEDVE